MGDTCKCMIPREGSTSTRYEKYRPQRCSPKKVLCHFICDILNRFIIAASVWKAPTSHTILLIPWCNVQTSRFSIISGTIWVNSFVVSGLNCNKINWRCNSTGAYPNSTVYHYIHLYESICIGLLRYHRLYLETTIKTWCTGISRRCSAIECHWMPLSWHVWSTFQAPCT